MLFRRCLALLGGTTRWPDCVEALCYLLRPTQLVRGIKIEEYERAFAEVQGVKHPIASTMGGSDFTECCGLLGSAKDQRRCSQSLRTLWLPTPYALLVTTCLRRLSPG
jgi:hypothetical protein